MRLSCFQTRLSSCTASGSRATFSKPKLCRMLAQDVDVSALLLHQHSRSASLVLPLLRLPHSLSILRPGLASKAVSAFFQRHFRRSSPTRFFSLVLSQSHAHSPFGGLCKTRQGHSPRSASWSLWNGAKNAAVCSFNHRRTALSESRRLTRLFSTRMRVSGTRRILVHSFRTQPASPPPTCHRLDQRLSAKRILLVLTVVNEMCFFFKFGTATNVWFDGLRGISLRAGVPCSSVPSKRPAVAKQRYQAAASTERP